MEAPMQPMRTKTTMCWARQLQHLKVVKFLEIVTKRMEKQAKIQVMSKSPTNFEPDCLCVTLNSPWKTHLRKTSLFPSRQCAENAHWLDGVVMGQDQLHSDEDQHLRIHGCYGCSVRAVPVPGLRQQRPHTSRARTCAPEHPTARWDINPCQMYSMCDSRSRTVGYTMLHSSFKLHMHLVAVGSVNSDKIGLGFYNDEEGCTEPQHGKDCWRVPGCFDGGLERKVGEVKTTFQAQGPNPRHTIGRNVWSI